MLKKVLIVFATLVAVLVVIIAVQPAQFSVTRSTTIEAPPSTVFALVNDFHQWALWSPWEKLDPDMKKEFSGAAIGKGSIYSWSGNDSVGEGRMTIVDNRPPERIEIKLEFLKPYAATNDTEFNFKPVGSSTEVSWTMSGYNNFMGKAFSLVMNIDQMVGKDFEKGLASMKQAAEAEAAKAKAAVVPPPPTTESLKDALTPQK
jgi:uncharacterized protein YndB with AHSA1/START domain